MIYERGMTHKMKKIILDIQSRTHAHNMERYVLLILTATFAMMMLLSGCSKSKLNQKDPITLTMWHVYGEQADSPMNQLIDEFNSTVGKDNGIIIDVTLMSSTSQIGEKLLNAQGNNAGAEKMPDLFFCHNSNAEELGADNLLNWNEYFTEEELQDYIPDFLEDGMVDGKLSVFPVSKSTHLLFLSGTQFDRFSTATGITYESLSTWNGFFAAAEKYYEWSGGKPFCAFDYLLRAVELNAMEKGGGNFYTDEGWYDFSNEALKSSYLEFADALAKGHIVVSDLYSNTQVMTGEVMAGLGSSAAILYYNDTVTFPDNTSEPMDLQVLPMPRAEGKELFVTQAGAGLCATKTTEQKAKAAVIFAKWLTESERNLEFCVNTGYMPVTRQAFDKIKSYQFTNTAYQNLYTALSTVNKNGTAVREPSFAGYYDKVSALYNVLREKQLAYPSRIQNGESADKLATESWELFCNIT